MCRDRCARTLAALLAVIVSSLAAGRATIGNEPVLGGPIVPAKEPCVLLRNGNVLFGQVLKQSGEYVVSRDGATLHLDAYQVQAVCADLKAAYTQRRQSVGPHDAISHLKLAEWCLQQGLLDQAGIELGEARRVEPTHPRVPMIDRRLAVARQPARPASAAPPVEPDRSLPAPGIVTHSLAPGPLDGHLGPDGLRTYPDDTMERFRRGIQPLLLNSCTTSGCHSGGGEYTFVLDRRALWRDAPRQMTIANLQAVLKELNRDAPLESRLLTAAIRPHAQPLSTPPIPVESVALARLKEWVLHVTGHDRPAIEPAEGIEDPPASTDEVPGESDEVEISEEVLDALFYGDDMDEKPARRNVQRGLPRPATAPTDPYDPEEFNRRFSGRNRSP